MSMTEYCDSHSRASFGIFFGCGEGGGEIMGEDHKGEDQRTGGTLTSEVWPVLSDARRFVGLWSVVSNTKTCNVTMSNRTNINWVHCCCGSFLMLDTYTTPSRAGLHHCTHVHHPVNHITPGYRGTTLVRSMRSPLITLR